MNITTETWNPSASAYSAVTTGMFDGVHSGHLKVLKQLSETAKTSGLCSTVVTFWPHPKHFFAPENHEPLLLTDKEERAQLIRAAGIDRLVTIEFNELLAEMSSEEFVQTILVDLLKAKKLVIGYDHRFGKGREGDFESLKANAPRYNFEVEEIPADECDHLAISSSRIRTALLGGKPAEAAQLLERNYSLTGTVVEGKQRGRKIGYPTANIQPSFSMKLLPATGVYAVKTATEYGLHAGMMNIGFNPTFENNGQKTLEVNIFDFSENLYGKNISVEFVEYLRPELKFDSVESLITQLHQDKIAATAALTSAKK